MHFKIKEITPLLLVHDLEAAIAFYVRQLGFTLVFRYEDFYASIEKDGHPIHLKTDYKAPKEARAQNEAENIDLLFAVDNLEALFEEISKKEIDIVQPLREMPYGKEFYIADPDGNLIAFVGDTVTK
ncbi:MAG: VOC family protein [Dyadobacter sp.]|uniref:VOC family protein n=1 Tax=Dyadobacter sp. TaxID=1914288 RepID=UPI001B1F70FD|nr:VOC family protein [Dyadobacter sp.]MBO9617147.1 VOC family protein [Dyadobacter sp.]